jgi:Carbohydrate family 9 binding domain-like
MKRNLLFKLFLLCLVLSGQNVNNILLAVSPEPGSITVKKCQDFKITGDGRSDNWKSTGWVNVVQQGSDPSVYQTKVKVLYSGTGIYFLFDCEDKKLTSTMRADNLDLYNEDVVEVFLWTDENFPVYFEYELSPLNFELPIIVPNNKGTFFGWLPWHYEGEKKTQHETTAIGGKKESGSIVKGWIAEFFIPYKLLAPLNQVPPVSGTKWRANMYRIDYDNGATHFAWQKITKSFHEYNNFGTFVFE